MKQYLKGFRSTRHLAPNQTVTYFDNGYVFQSYNSEIVICVDNQIYLDSAWDYSKTTGKYRNIVLNESKKTTESKIKSGQYKLLSHE